MDIKQYNYSRFAEYYDILELEDYTSLQIIRFLHNTFQKYKISTVLDFTCGTGAQTIPLTKRGYKVTACDINTKMMEMAKRKAKGLSIDFHQGDLRKSYIGNFDAVIAIFNAIGHLSKKDFNIAVKNVSRNLKDQGIFIFDIFNLDFMIKGGFITHEYMDKVIDINGLKMVRFNNNTLNKKTGIIKIMQKIYIQKDLEKPQIINENWDYQIYSIIELTEILQKNGFKVLEVFGGPGTKFENDKSLSLYLVTQKLN
ncbi:methyltransferase domain-containing protein [Candidatus Woesearchaeota archaeon]|nr:methyltransferase domain-containing protein [Candidatus Woesearchaeota archaeon]